MTKVSIGILGATSYTGSELIRMLARHSGVQLSFVSSKTYAGQKMSAVFPELLGLCDLTLVEPEEAQNYDVQCVFSCLPHAVSAENSLPFINKGSRIIDLSADFRISDVAVYEQWYKTTHPCPQLLKDAVYGLPEHYRAAIAKAQIIANPGCYPTSILLPLLPLLKDSATQVHSVIADSKSGVSGAGRALKLNTHYVEANENFSAYSVGRAHRHIAEIDQELSVGAGKPMAITFSPHLTPMNRGILSTIYVQTNRSAAEALELARAAYATEPFVRVRPSSDLPSISAVAHSNFCDFTYCGGQEGQPLIVVSVIDNLIKGSSGQALQNFNIMFGMDERMGLI